MIWHGDVKRFVTLTVPKMARWCGFSIWSTCVLVQKCLKCAKIFASLNFEVLRYSCLSCDTWLHRKNISTSCNVDIFFSFISNPWRVDLHGLWGWNSWRLFAVWSYVIRSTWPKEQLSLLLLFWTVALLYLIAWVIISRKVIDMENLSTRYW